jgi:hypothetical protein
MLFKTVSDKPLQKIELKSYPIIRPTPIPTSDCRIYRIAKENKRVAAFLPALGFWAGIP